MDADVGRAKGGEGVVGIDPQRVDLALQRLEVVEVRYDAGRFGSGYKARPKSDTSIRPVPMATWWSRRFADGWRVARLMGWCSVVLGAVMG